MSPHGQLCKWTSLMVLLLKFSEDNLRVSSYEENSFLHSSTRELFPFVFVNVAQIYLNKTGANPRNCQAWRCTEQENTSFISSCLYLLNATLPSNKPPKLAPWMLVFGRINFPDYLVPGFSAVCGSGLWDGHWWIISGSAGGVVRSFDEAGGGVCFEQLYSNTAINRPLNKDWKIRPQIPFEYDIFPERVLLLLIPCCVLLPSTPYVVKKSWECN